ncbi:hypothetical protein [Basfia succiniciproducens]|uniref:hypothetical protein n=1 Tax=Basfia succiniciproducens TaxID=653940 RepID=UPI0008CDB87C|nr:hypothetical protein [Basfia succiniciproducens]SEQ87897.1 hypothetical protein SAMN02910415_02199 [Basfia succiniciproducens]
MTKKFDNLVEIADEIDLQSNSTVKDIIDTITDIGHSDNVYSRYDEFLGLYGDISSEFKNMKIGEADNYSNLTEEEQQQYDRIIEVATEVISLSNKELSDDEREELEQEQEDWNSYIENINKD